MLQGTFRSIMVLKNRFGDCDAEVGCNFFGGINYFSELKKPDEIYDYEQYTDPNYLLKDSMKEDNIKENKEDQNNSNLNFIL